jgi:hypothetical protein
MTGTGGGEIAIGGGLFFILLGDAFRETGREPEGWKWAGGCKDAAPGVAACGTL